MMPREARRRSGRQGPATESPSKSVVPASPVPTNTSSSISLSQPETTPMPNAIDTVVVKTERSESPIIWPSPSRSSSPSLEPSQKIVYGWKHPAELDYITPNDWSDAKIIYHLIANSFNVPPREKNIRGSRFTSITATNGSTIVIPMGYRIPLMFIARFQWLSLKLVLTASANLKEKEWNDYKFGILHVSRLCKVFFDKAQEQLGWVEGSGRLKGVDRKWRCETFDRALARYRLKWFLSDPSQLAEFWDTYQEEEYEKDILQYNWRQWAVKGHRGFALTEDEIANGFTAQQLMSGLKLLKPKDGKGQGTWHWETEDVTVPGGIDGWDLRVEAMRAVGVTPREAPVNRKSTGTSTKSTSVPTTKKSTPSANPSIPKTPTPDGQTSSQPPPSSSQNQNVPSKRPGSPLENPVTKRPSPSTATPDPSRPSSTSSTPNPNASSSASTVASASRGVGASGSTQPSAKTKALYVPHAPGHSGVGGFKAPPTPVSGNGNSSAASPATVVAGGAIGGNVGSGTTSTQASSSLPTPPNSAAPGTGKVANPNMNPAMNRVGAISTPSTSPTVATSPISNTPPGLFTTTILSTSSSSSSAHNGSIPRTPVSTTTPTPIVPSSIPSTTGPINPNQQTLTKQTQPQPHPHSHPHAFAQQNSASHQPRQSSPLASKPQVQVAVPPLAPVSKPTSTSVSQFPVPGSAASSTPSNGNTTATNSTSTSTNPTTPSSTANDTSVKKVVFGPEPPPKNVSSAPTQSVYGALAPITPSNPTHSVVPSTKASSVQPSTAPVPNPNASLSTSSAIPSSSVVGTNTTPSTSKPAVSKSPIISTSAPAPIPITVPVPIASVGSVPSPSLPANSAITTSSGETQTQSLAFSNITKDEAARLMGSKEWRPIVGELASLKGNGQDGNDSDQVEDPSPMTFATSTLMPVMITPYPMMNSQASKTPISPTTPTTISSTPTSGPNVALTSTKSTSTQPTSTQPTNVAYGPMLPNVGIPSVGTGNNNAGVMPMHPSMFSPFHGQNHISYYMNPNTARRSSAGSPSSPLARPSTGINSTTSSTTGTSGPPGSDGASGISQAGNPGGTAGTSGVGSGAGAEGGSESTSGAKGATGSRTASPLPSVPSSSTPTISSSVSTPRPSSRLTIVVPAPIRATSTQNVSITNGTRPASSSATNVVSRGPGPMDVDRVPSTSNGVVTSDNSSSTPKSLPTASNPRTQTPGVVNGSGASANATDITMGSVVEKTSQDTSSVPSSSTSSQLASRTASTSTSSGPKASTSKSTTSTSTSTSANNSSSSRSQASNASSIASPETMVKVIDSLFTGFADTLRKFSSEISASRDDTIKSLSSQVRTINSQLNTVKSELRNELQSDMRATVRQELNWELRAALRADTKRDIREGVREEIGERDREVMGRVQAVWEELGKLRQEVTYSLNRPSSSATGSQHHHHQPQHQPQPQIVYVQTPVPVRTRYATTVPSAGRSHTTHVRSDSTASGFGRFAGHPFGHLLGEPDPDMDDEMEVDEFEDPEVIGMAELERINRAAGSIGNDMDGELTMSRPGTAQSMSMFPPGSPSGNLMPAKSQRKLFKMMMGSASGGSFSEDQTPAGSPGVSYE